MNVFANIRAHVLRRSLEQLRDQGKSASMGSQVTYQSTELHCTVDVVQGRGGSPGRHGLASPAAATAVTPDQSGTPTGKKLSILQGKAKKRMTKISVRLEV